MEHKCDLCGRASATLTDRTIVNNGMVEYRFCEQCYKSIVRSGKTSFELMQEMRARKGKECSRCGKTSADFQHTFMFGCPDCYREMRELASGAVYDCQHAVEHSGKTPYGGKI